MFYFCLHSQLNDLLIAVMDKKGEYILSTLDDLESMLNQITMENPKQTSSQPCPISPNMLTMNIDESTLTLSNQYSLGNSKSDGSNFMDELDNLEKMLKQQIKPSESQSAPPKKPLPHVYNNFSAPIIFPSNNIRPVSRMEEMSIDSLIKIMDGNYDTEPINKIPPTPLSDEQENVMPKQEDKIVFNSFEELLLDPNYTLIKSLTKTLQLTEATKMCVWLVFIFHKHGRCIEMIEKLIEFEVQLQSSAGTLFRNNSITTHMMTSFTKLIGRPYLKSTIGPVIIETFDKIDQGLESFEIDPDKIELDEDLNTNISNLRALVHMFFDRILNSRSIMPKPVIEICGFLQKYTLDKFPNSRYAVIGGFLFLRFLCPAIVAPDGHKIIEGVITDSQRRMLILVSKILQTIANEREFEDKEEYMKCMNPLVLEYQGIIQYFFNQLAKPVVPSMPDNVLPISITQTEYNKTMDGVFLLIKTIKEKLLASEYIISDEKVYNTIQKIEELPLLIELPGDALCRRGAISVKKS